MAAALKQEKDVTVEVMDGKRGELTVLVDGQEVAHKTDDHMPTTEEVTAALHGAGHAA